MQCKILCGNVRQDVPLEDQLNNFLANKSYKIEDIKIVPSTQLIYVFIFYTENNYLKETKGDN